MALWGAGGVAVGQTADGTLWVWGLDFTHQAALDLATRLRIARARLGAVFGLVTGGRMTPTGFGIAPTFIREPRPLVKMEPPPKP